MLAVAVASIFAVLAGADALPFAYDKLGADWPPGVWGDRAWLFRLVPWGQPAGMVIPDAADTTLGSVRVVTD